MTFQTPWFKYSWLKSPGLESSWLINLRLKGLGLKLGVEKSGVEMSFNLENYFFKFETRSCKNFEINVFEQYQVRPIFNLLLEIFTAQLYTWTTKVPIGKNNWEVETYRNKVGNVLFSSFFWWKTMKKCCIAPCVTSLAHISWPCHGNK